MFRAITVKVNEVNMFRANKVKAMRSTCPWPTRSTSPWPQTLWSRLKKTLFMRLFGSLLYFVGPSLTFLLGWQVNVTKCAHQRLFCPLDIKPQYKHTQKRKWHKSTRAKHTHILLNTSRNQDLNGHGQTQNDRRKKKDFFSLNTL